MRQPPRQAGFQTPTLKDVAALVRCSLNTASLALRDSPRISRAMRRRIARAARRLHYIPNSAARNLARKRSGLIGLYTRALYDAVRSDLIHALLAELHTAEYRPVLGLGAGHEGPWHTSPWARTFLELKVEAIVVVVEGTRSLPRWPRPLPVVLVGCQPADNLACDYLGLDRREGARLGIAHLLARGHRRILVASSARGDFGSACARALRDAGAEPILAPDQTFARPETIDLVLDRARATRPSAVIFGDSPLAVRFIHRARQAGFRVPDDLAVLGYDYFPWADMLEVPLTTVEQPIRDMAEEAVRLVKTRLQNPAMPFQHVVLPHELVVRASA